MLGTQSQANPDGVVSLSPDGEHYVMRVVRGDVKRNGVWMELLVGDTASLASASRLRPAAKLFSTGLGPPFMSYLGSQLDTANYASPLRWLDNEHVAFLWSDPRELRQVVSVNILTRQICWLTQHPTSVAQFAYSDGVLVYNAQRRRPPPDPAALRDGFVVPQHTDAYSVVRGDFSGDSVIDRRMNSEWFVRDNRRAPARQLQVTRRGYDLDVRHRIVVSPLGRWALVDATPDDIPESWDHYTEPDLRNWIGEARRDPRAPSARNVHQWYLIDLREGSARPLLDAPTTGTTDAAWSADGRFVVLAPTQLPVALRETDEAEEAVVVVEVATGDVAVLPVVLPAMTELNTLRWRSEVEVELAERTEGRDRTAAQLRWHRFRFDGARWLRIEAAGPPASAASLRFEVRQDLNTSPRVVAVEPASARERLVLELNPSLGRDIALARVEHVSGELSSGVRWEGLLFYPRNKAANRRYPLVIQSTYGGGMSEEFTLYGPQEGVGLGPAPLAPYAGQLLAARGIAVLHLTVHVGEAFNTPQEAPTYQQAFEEVAAHFVVAGWVDPQRIGLLGFSRNGYYVEYTLTHSRFAFAAAIAADNWDPSYFQQTLLSDVARTAAVTGAEPFGDGLLRWLERAPGFNVEKIRTPLRMVELSHGGAMGVLSKWELFSRLRYLNRPVEFYVMPQADRGAHNPQNPAQILGVQQGSVDWFDFWLNDREDPAPSKVLQYERWRRLRQLQSSSIDVER